MNTINDWKTVATIHNPERLESTRRIFGGDKVPILSIVPTKMDLPGHPNALAYMMDLKAITSEQRQRLVESIAARFSLDASFIDGNLDIIGVPVLADDVVVTSTDQGLVLSAFNDDFDDWGVRDD